MNKVLYLLSLLAILSSIYSFDALAQHTGATKLSMSAEELAMRNKVGKIDTERVVKIQNLVKSYAYLKWFSGSIIVAKNGVPIYKTAGGFASLDYKVSCALETKFNMCSITQSFTALAIMQLVEDAKIDLQAPAKNYLPEDLAGLISPQISVHQLLTHTAGLPDYYSIPAYMVNFLDIKSIGDLLKIVLTQPAQFSAGERFSFSNSHYVALAAIVAKVSGEPYEEYIKNHIFKPAGMTSATLSYWYDVVGNRAMAYQFNSKHKARTNADMMGAYPFGAEAIYCSIEDLLRYEKALKSASLLTPDFQDIMYTPFAKNDEGEEYGYGWKVKTLKGKRAIYQGGTIEGISTQMRRYPDDGYTIIVLSNYHLDRANEVAEKIENALFEDDFFVPSNSPAYYIYTTIEKEGFEKVKNNLDDVLEQVGIRIEKPISLNKLCSELMYSKKYDIAYKILSLNAQKFPQDPSVLDVYGEYYYQTQNYPMSVQYFKQKLNIQPNDKRAKGMIAFLSTQSAKNPPPLADANTNNSPTGITTKTGNNIQAPNTAAINLNNTVNNKTMPTTAPPPNSFIASNSLNAKKHVPTAASTAPNEHSTNAPMAAVLKPVIEQKSEFESSIAEVAPVKFENEPPPISEKTDNDKLFERAGASAKQQPDTVYTLVPQMPEFPGGQKAAYAYLSNNLKYPPEALQNNIEGTVYVKFIVSASGNIVNAVLERGLGGNDYGCNEEALRLIRSMPKWEPGRLEGNAVNVSYTIAIPFKKQTNKQKNP